MLLLDEAWQILQTPVRNPGISLGHNERARDRQLCAHSGLALPGGSCLDSDAVGFVHDRERGGDPGCRDGARMTVEMLSASRMPTPSKPVSQVSEPAPDRAPPVQCHRSGVLRAGLPETTDGAERPSGRGLPLLIIARVLCVPV